jgi:hypothetical protein
MPPPGAKKCHLEVWFRLRFLQIFFEDIHVVGLVSIFFLEFFLEDTLW